MNTQIESSRAARKPRPIGCLLLAGLVLARINPWFILIDWFVSLGLVLGGATGYCPMAMLLGKMPWNRVSCCGPAACSRGTRRRSR